MPKSGNSNAEQHRQDEQYSATDPQPWSLWGPYLSERQWGTVREDYSPQGTAWEYFPHDHARRGGEGDRPFLERIFYKLMLNFTWWVNRKDAEGRNVFQGGFLELDNIGVFDRSAPFPTGGHMDQADGTSWMAMYSLNLMRIALELAQHNPVYEDVATKRRLEWFLRYDPDVAGKCLAEAPHACYPCCAAIA